MTPDLKPCPLCLGEACFGNVRYSESFVKSHKMTQSEFHYVCCIQCGTKNHNIIGFETEEEAAEHWNTRPDDPEIAKLRRECDHWKANHDEQVRRKQETKAFFRQINGVPDGVREALEYYADRTNYIPPIHDVYANGETVFGSPPVKNDEGAKAREALEILGLTPRRR